MQDFEKTLFGGGMNAGQFMIRLDRNRRADRQQKLGQVDTAFSRCPKQWGVSVPASYIGAGSRIKQHPYDLRVTSDNSSAQHVIALAERRVRVGSAFQTNPNQFWIPILDRAEQGVIHIYI